MQEANFYKRSWSTKTTYQVVYSADDPSGVTMTELLKTGEVEKRYQWSENTHLGHSPSFSTGAKETILDGLAGATVKIRATDRHQNVRTKVAMERTNVWGSVAKELATEIDGSDTEIALGAGLLSGLSVGAGGTGRAIDSIVSNPYGFYQTLTQLISLARNLGLVHELLNSLPEQLVEDLKQKQQVNNPYDKQTESAEYESFKEGWYISYGFYYLASTLVGEKAKTAVKSTKTFSNLMERLESDGKLSEALGYMDAVKGRTTGRAKRVTFELGERAAKGSWHLSKKSGRRVVAGVKTAAGKYDARQRLGSLSDHTLAKIEGYSPETQRFVGPVLSRLGRDGEEFLEEADSDDVTQMMQMRRVMADGGRLTIDESRLWSYRLAKLVGSDEVSSDEYAKYLDNLEAMNHERREELVELTLESDSASAKDAVQFTNDYVRLRQVDRIDSDNVEDNLEDVYQLALTGDSGNFAGAAFEARYAASKADDVLAIEGDLKDIERIENRPGDIDVLTEENGERIGHELKSSSDKGEVGDIVEGYEELIDKGVVDDYRLVFKRDPSNELEQYMDSNGINYEVYTPEE
ncbi:hypothetical protein [Halorussus caseinilyticus]|uniref:Restriction endonuclease n=1 Tax=Halorussus caseinilyticus TaxID=3034025 RepID=A0ABD5WFG2_9EURY